MHCLIKREPGWCNQYFFTRSNLAHMDIKMINRKDLFWKEWKQS
ncbi:unnamed protein product [Larinioides sclopetarius]|uniref:Uncharacterized protein n=1 Tax=Larinioides sclopetarius TaxID=280406 RepID=A0AAV2BIP6_9ARAC